MITNLSKVKLIELFKIYTGKHDLKIKNKTKHFLYIRLVAISNKNADVALNSN